MGCDIHMRVEVRRPPTDYASIPAMAAELDMTLDTVASLVGVSREKLDELIAGDRDALSHHQLRVLGRAISRSLATFVPRWHLLGPVFESKRDFALIDATREVLEAMSDGELLDALTAHACQEESAFRTQLARAENAAAVLRRFGAHATRMKRDARRTARLRERVEHDRLPEVWTLEARLRRERRAQVHLRPSQRAAAIEAAVRAGYGSGEKADPLLLLVDRAEGDPPFMTETPWQGRDYDLFAVLADVRNGGYFGELPRVSPIEQPRGIPRDASAEGRAFMESWGGDGHSHTYHTLAELQAVDWEARELREWLLVAGDTYLRARAGGELEPAAHDPAEVIGARQFTPEGFEAWLAMGSPYIAFPCGSWWDGDPYIDPELLRRLLHDEVPEVDVAPDRMQLPRGTVVAVHDRVPAQRERGETRQAVLRRKLLAGELSIEQFELAIGDAIVLADGEELPPIIPFVLTSTTQTLAEALSPAWFEHTLVQLEQQIPPGGNAADVRLICFFDN